MSSVSRLRVPALRILGATMLGAIAVATTSVGSSAETPRTLAVLVPIVADAGDGQLLTAEVVERETADGGDWALLAEAASRHGFTIALDSRISASIAALGSDAPESAVAWLDAVSAEDPLLLPWGNADVWSIAPWTARSFGAAQFGDLGATDPDSLVVWPSGDVISTDAVVTTTARGFTRMLAGDDLVDGGFDSVASGALRDAVAPDSSISPVAGAAAIMADLGRSSTIVLPRSPDDIDVARAVAVLDRLVRQGIRIVPVEPLAISTPPVTQTENPSAALLESLRAAIIADEDRASTLTDDTEALLTSRLRSLAVVTGNLDEDVLSLAATTFLDDTDWLSRLISISLSTEYTVLSNSAEVPVSVSNLSGAPVTVTVRVRSTSGIVQVEVPVQSVTIEPRSNIRITVPMTAVTNGRTALVASLVDPRGDSIGSPVPFPIEVQAQWEIVTIIVFFGSVSVIMAIGIIRTIRRRRAAV